jgi:hypothetical protein
MTSTTWCSEPLIERLFVVELQKLCFTTRTHRKELLQGRDRSATSVPESLADPKAVLSSNSMPIRVVMSV